MPGGNSCTSRWGHARTNSRCGVHAWADALPGSGACGIFPVPSWTAAGKSYAASNALLSSDGQDDDARIA
jgi:hypothetical protein